MNTTQIIFEVVKLCVMSLGIVVPLVIAVFQLKKRFDWDKSMLAYELGRVWTEKTLEHRKIIEEKYGAYFVTSKPITPPECELFVHSKVGDEHYPVKIAVIALMNYLEDIAVLYASGMADKHIIDITLRQPLIRYYDKVHPLAQCIDNVAGYSSWKPLDDAVAKWKQDDAKKAVVKAKKFF